MDIIKNISIIFLSIFFESLPFLFLGAIISSIIEEYISNEKIAELIPKNRVLGSIVGVFLGIFIPACDCAVIPITKRLIKKEVPINVAVSFMLASPIINPVVILSTYYAFYRTNPEIFWYRIFFGILVSLIIGIIMGIIFTNKNVITNDKCECLCHEEDKIDEDFKDLLNDIEKENHSIKKNIIHIFKHTSVDLYEVLKYLILGALIASIIQVLLPRNILLMFNKNHILSVLAMMMFAYLISLCSTADSFIGKTLLTSFTKSSVIAYLLLGPMIDIKNTIVLFGNYKKSFVLTLISLIFISVFLVGIMVILL